VSKMFLMCFEMTDLPRWKRSAIRLRVNQTDSWISLTLIRVRPSCVR
jgi:hypothetical protein